MMELVGDLRAHAWKEGRFQCLMLMVKELEELGTQVVPREVEARYGLEGPVAMWLPCGIEERTLLPEVARAVVATLTVVSSLSVLKVVMAAAGP